MELNNCEPQPDTIPEVPLGHFICLMWKKCKYIILISNSWSAILLSFYFPEAMSHNFVLKVKLSPSKKIVLFTSVKAY